MPALLRRIEKTTFRLRGMEASRLQIECFEERCICRGVVIRICLCQFVNFSILLMFARKRNLVKSQSRFPLLAAVESTALRESSDLVVSETDQRITVRS